jgi:hypothetical protein
MSTFSVSSRARSRGAYSVVVGLAQLSGLHVSRIYQIHQKDDAELT